MGWTTVRLGWRDQKGEAVQVAPLCHASTAPDPKITNEEWSIEVKSGAVCIQRHGENVFGNRKNLEIRLVDDPWGSWGGMNEERDSYQLNDLREVWKLERSEVLESGPLRAKLWTRWSGKNSWLDLTFSVAAGTPWLKVDGRLLWNERSARLKMVFPCRGRLKYQVPGGNIVRDSVEGQVSGGRWVVRSNGRETLGLASDVLGDFDANDDELRVTLARASRYANDVKTSMSEKIWQPATDCGELKFQLCLFGEGPQPDHVADALLYPPATLTTPATKGPWPRHGGLANLSPSSMRLLSLDHSTADQLRARVQNGGTKTAEAVLRLGENRLSLGRLEPEEIQTFLLKKDASREGRWICKNPVPNPSGTQSVNDRRAEQAVAEKV
ncbi:MAG: glycoside hydrolase family 38 C-terminal domain-containing protein [Chthoniobacteraceae bacterium]|nr:glycoside hydrolase family 38 C-terminal domain-containing protein [Chthoniobacteraceae bacterium]